MLSRWLTTTKGVCDSLSGFYKANTPVDVQNWSVSNIVVLKKNGEVCKWFIKYWRNETLPFLKNGYGNVIMAGKQQSLNGSF